MKLTKLFLASLLAPAFLLSSCDDVNGPGKNTATFTLPAVNLITETYGDSPSTMSSALYTMTMDYGDNKLSLACPAFNFNGKPTCAFGCEPVSFEVTDDQGYENFYFKPLPTRLQGTDYMVSNMNFVASNRYYWANENESLIPGIALNNSNLYTRLIGSFDIGNEYKVKIVQPHAFYRGTTTTNVDNFTTNETSYRAIITLGDKPEKYKADVVIYNAKFAANMPLALRCIVLKDLKVELHHGYYKIAGENIIPEVFDANGSTPYPKFTFDTFELTPTGPYLVEAEINFTVAGRFVGNFKGRYAEI